MLLLTPNLPSDEIAMEGFVSANEVAVETAES